MSNLQSCKTPEIQQKTKSLNQTTIPQSEYTLTEKIFLPLLEELAINASNGNIPNFRQTVKEFVAHIETYATKVGEDANEAGYDSGYDDGKNNGFDNGYSEGFDEGKDEGFEAGKEEGDTEGYNRGFAEGKVEGKEEGDQEGYDRGYEDAKREFTK